MTSYTLRPYQQHAVESAVAYLHNPKLRHRHGLIVQPTGSGKSLVIANIAAQLNGPCIVLQPSREILAQNLAKLAHYGYKAAVFSASFNRREIGTITLATIGSVIDYVDHFGPVPYVLIDECHLVSAQGGMYHDFIRALPNARILGLTATPYRLASNSFGSQLRFLTRTTPRIFRDVVHYTQLRDLFAAGYLCPLQYRDAICVRREHLKLNSTGADYTDASVQAAMFEVGFVGRLQDEVEYELQQGRKNVLVFTRFVDEAERLARVVKHGAVVTANTPDGERKAILDDYKRGALKVVANVGIIALGFDYPELESVVLGRPSISLALYYQQVGRIIRPHPNKPRAHVVDMVGLTRQFGPIEDLDLVPITSGKAVDVNAIDWSSPAAQKVPYQKWEIATDGRPLTNIYFSDRDSDGVDAKARAKAFAKRRYWAKQKGASRRRGTLI